ncbi:tRNA pseudouridine(55) synthase TruB [Tautonia plasticadhaerens]|uniref:tRNA pseudouridine synthase B n=1 Tax=Tautonia plasticadhaerens TaxID=2527974 RepID=A0A518HAF6_9BACT|nr:tRNA pseudouridine(55) synthase TruB [Tautonia plasticadhaerens]QDV37736.1 tRNA pseudouridine synthase B [Tautonia plasticadhaerens]
MPAAESRPPCGLLNLDKPIGLTSRDVVNRVAYPLKKAKVKVGHAGTLDPLASGVLVVAVGPATRLIEQVQRRPKSYAATILLGATSDTLDADGAVTPVPDAPVPSADAVRSALASQVGEVEQMPPAYSALRVGGKRAYDLAREGRAVDLAPRRVRIDRVALVRYEWPHLEIEVDCGSGTYIRSIARDVGEALGCGGLIAALRRTRIGPFLVEDALPPDPDRLTAETIPGLLRPALDAVDDLPRLSLTPEQEALVRLGRPLGLASGVGPPAEPGEVALLGPDGLLVALAEADPGSGLYRPRRVLAG